MNGQEQQVDRLQRGFLLLFLALVTLSFAWLIEPFFSAIVWSVVAAILFSPLYMKIMQIIPGRSNIAAFLTMLIIIAVFIIPAIFLGIALFRQASAVYENIRSGDIDFGRSFVTLFEKLPLWMQSQLKEYELYDLQTLRYKLDAIIANSADSLFTYTFNIGESAFSAFLSLGIMLYLTYFLLRDGEKLAPQIREMIPLEEDQRNILADKFLSVVRATIKGGFIVAVLQGTIGGLIFWILGIQGVLLWGVLMGFMSLLPAVGTGVVWIPVSIYLLVTGDTWQGVTLIICGIFIIGGIDNVIRPILVGRDTRMPDYIVLISTLGGLQIFGFPGIVVGPMLAALFLAVWTMFGASRKAGKI